MVSFSNWPFLVKKDTSLFASKAEQVSRLNVQIKDGLTEIQNDAEEIQMALRTMQAPSKPKKSSLGGNGVVHTTQEH